MQKKYNSFNLAVTAAALVAVLSTSANAGNVAELPAKNISGDLAVLAMQAQNDGWHIVSTSDDTIKMQKSLSETRRLSGVHTRWKRVTDTVDATVVAKLSNGKILLSTTTDIKSPGHKEQLNDALASLEQKWQGIHTASARYTVQTDIF